MVLHGLTITALCELTVCYNDVSQCSTNIYFVLAARQRRKVPPISNKSKVNSLDILHEHTLASVSIDRPHGDVESSESSGSDKGHHTTLPDGCIKAVEALCEQFK